MKSKIEFVNFEKSPALARFIEGKLRTLKRRFDKAKREVFAFVRLSVDAKGPTGILKNAKAEVLIKWPRVKKQIIALKKNRDIRVAVADAIKSIEKMLRRESAKRKTATRKTAPKKAAKKSSTKKKR